MFVCLSFMVNFKNNSEKEKKKKDNSVFNLKGSIHLFTLKLRKCKTRLENLNGHSTLINTSFDIFYCTNN